MPDKVWLFPWFTFTQEIGKNIYSYWRRKGSLFTVWSGNPSLKIKAAKITSCFSKCWPNSCCLTFVCAKLLYKKRKEERRVWKHSSSCMQKKTHGSFQPGLCHLACVWMAELKASHLTCLLAIEKTLRVKQVSGVNANSGITLAALLDCTSFWSSHVPPISAGKFRRGCCVIRMFFSDPGSMPGLLQPSWWVCSATPCLQNQVRSWRRGWRAPVWWRAWNVAP